MKIKGERKSKSRMLKVLAVVMAFATANAEEAISLGEYSQRVRSAVERQIRATLEDMDAADSVSGTVAMVMNGAVYLQGKTDALKLICDRVRGVKLVPGDSIVAKGSPSLEGGRVVFVATTIQRIGSGELPKPRKISASDLLIADDAKSGVNWRLIEIEGRVIGLTENGFAMNVEQLPITIVADRLPTFLDDCGETRPKVRVFGVAEQVLDQSSLFGRARYVVGVKVLIGRPEDVVLEPDIEYLIHRRDRRIRLAVVGVFALLAILLLAFLVVMYRQSRRNLRSATLMIERKRMADDLHDTIEQHLVGAGMLLQLGKTKEAREILVRAKKEMRDIVWGLKNDDMMRMTPTEMIRELVKEENRKGVTRVDARLQGLPEHLDAGKMRDLSLIIREAIGNAIKHGGAKKIAIAADAVGENGWCIRISNDGAPFASKTAPGVEQGHFGLDGMRQRARRLNADLEFALRNNRTTIIIKTL